VIKNAVIYFSGRLPMVADLRAVPAPTDLTMLVTNLRTRDGKRPSFADSSESWFVLPLREVMAIELPPGALEADQPAGATPPPIHLGPPATADAALTAATPPALPVLPDVTPLEPDEELLARIRQL
jgi:hypothetical protein